jgi:hypothetical protein
MQNFRQTTIVTRVNPQTGRKDIYRIKRKLKLTKLPKSSRVKTSKIRDENCSICWEAFGEDERKGAIRLDACKHYFHELCIREWVTPKDGKPKNLTCPLCRECIF